MSHQGVPELPGGAPDAAVKEAAAVIDHAVEYGKASKNPSVDDVFDDVYA